MKERVLFTLTMPNVGSWNGRWSGENQNYSIVRSVPKQLIKERNIPTSFYHNFGDGWGASVSSRIMSKGERKPKSAGFCGYEWMVDRFLKWGDTKCRHKWINDRHYEGFITCTLCRCSKKKERTLWVK